MDVCFVQLVVYELFIFCELESGETAQTTHYIHLHTVISIRRGVFGCSTTPTGYRDMVQYPGIPHVTYVYDIHVLCFVCFL